CSSDSGSNVLF
nr:immunoglobulin light chain junction region [Macaca mulatta]